MRLPKNAIILLHLFLLAACTNTGVIVPKGWDDEENKTLYGSIRTITVSELEYSTYNGSIIKHTKDIYMFGVDNNVTERYRYIDSRLWNKMMYSYDENGNIIEERLIMSPENYEKKTIYSYSSKGELQSEKRIGADGSLSSEYNYRYSYDKGKLVEEASYEPDGKILSKTYYSYNENGQLIEKHIISGIEEYVKYTYENGLLKKEIHEGLWGDYEFEYHYLSDGKISSINYYEDKELFETIKFEEYDAIGNAILIKCYDNNSKLDWERQYEIMYR